MQKANGSQESLAATKHGTQKVLFVDDVSVTRAIAKLALESGGDFVLQPCASGEEAISEAVSFAPDLIILDVIMPGIDGSATLQALRKLPEIASTPVIFMTGDVQPEHVARYLALGAVGVIAKPFDPTTLAARIKEILLQPSTESPPVCANMAAEVIELRLAYLKELPQKLGQIKAAIQRYQDTLNPEALRKTHFLAHRLAGSAGSFGFPEIGVCAKKLEENLLPWLSGDSNLTPKTFDKVNALYEALDKEIALADIKYAPRNRDHSQSE
ncbi:MAG: response regulator receiver protein [Proteobacteria bacterium]|nr:response regulator receiver protein [Pseudomonadota bacterium]